MKTYICKNCGNIVNTVYLKDDYKCPKCNSNKEAFTVFEEKIDENEMDAIIESLIVGEHEKSLEKIINDNEDNFIKIDSSNKCIQRLKEKCIECGQCKKTCENIANISYNLNECKKPICIGCGQCILNCPSRALKEKENYLELKTTIDLNNRIIVGLISPALISELSEFYDEKYTITESKLIEGLKKIGFDFVYNSSFGSDLYIFEEVAELMQRVKNKKNLPLISSNCPAWTNYTEIYHPELLNNLYASIGPIEMQASLIKNYFADIKGFDKKNIVVVSLSTCTASKNKEIDNVDYYLTINELIKMFNEYEVKLDNLNGKTYDNIIGEYSGGGLIFETSGGECENIIRTLYRIMSKKELNSKFIEFKELRGFKGIKEANIIINRIKIKVAVVQKIGNFEKLLNTKKFKDYHFIEVMNCEGGCLGGGGSIAIPIEEFESNKEKYLENLYNEDRSSSNRYPYNNEEMKKLYREFLDKPAGDKCKELFYYEFKNKSEMLKNK